MELLLQYLIYLGPFVLAAVVLGIGLAVYSPWLFRNPSHWLFLLILLISLVSFGDGGTGSEGSVVKQLSWGGLFAYCACWLLVKTNRAASNMRNVPILLLVLLAFAAASVAWSPVPLVSARRYVQLLGVLLIGLVVVRHVPLGKGLLEMMTLPAAICMMGGVALAGVLPGIAFDADHALKGFSSHKNTWGQFSLLCCLIFAVCFAIRRERRWPFALLLLMSVASLLASKSTTSLLTFGILLFLVLAWLAINRTGFFGRVVFALAIAVILVSVHVYFVLHGNMPFERLADLILSATEKTGTLTGRTHLWVLMLQEIERHPFLGIGFGGFWTGLDGASRGVILRLNWGPPSQAHSGYIDVLNEIGVVGALMAALLVILHSRDILRLYRRGGTDRALFHGAILVCALTINYTESSFLRTTHFWWIVMCVSFLEVRALLLQTNRLPHVDAGSGRTFSMMAAR